MSRLVCTPDEVMLALGQHTPKFVPALPGRTNHLQSAVVIPLYWGEELEAVATLRPMHLGHHGGEVCFPGGKPEEGDETLQATGLRELWEELGMRPSKVLGRLSSIPLYTSDFRITPFVIAVEEKRIRVNRDEVDRELWFSMDAIFQQPVIDGFEVTIGQTSKLSPVFVVDGAIMFGATAYALLELLEVLGRLTGRVVPPMALTEYRWDSHRKRPVPLA